MKILYYLLFTLSIASCGTRGSQLVTDTKEYCGESFCLNVPRVGLIEVSQPIEDFKIHRIIIGERVYVIYEGDNPDISGEFVRNIRGRHLRGRMFRDGNAVKISYEVNGSMPFSRVMVSTECRPSHGCDIEGFVQSLRTPQ